MIKSSYRNRKSDSWGGFWTNQKLDAFISYVKAYLKIMKKNPFWKTIYFDGFAGSGERLKKEQELQGVIEFPVDKNSLDGIEIYKGSVERILDLRELIFDYYYFIDNNQDSISKINSLRKDITHIQSRQIITIQDDCNRQLPKLAKALKTGEFTALIFLDPFGMQVNWESIASLKNTRSDIWILIPSGIAVNRLLSKSGVVRNKTKLEKFFGESYDNLRNLFYKDISTDTLFGKNDRIEKMENPIDKIAELYRNKMSTIWKYVTSKPLILKNSKNVPIFHLLFGSNNENARKIASQIISKRQK